VADEATDVGLDHGPPTSFPLYHVDLGPDPPVLFQVGGPTTDGDGLNGQGTHSQKRKEKRKYSLQCICVAMTPYVSIRVDPLE
jgi:hypothetical protein